MEIDTRDTFPPRSEADTWDETTPGTYAARRPETISGFVEGIHGTELHGWIVNHTHPEILEEIVCHGDLGTARFRAFLHRLEVCRAVRLSGRFGFAIPISLLQRLGRRIRVTDRRGTPLEQSDVAVPATLEAGAGPSDKSRAAVAHIFLHVQKTGGTSVRSALARLLLASEQLHVYPDANCLSPRELISIPMAQRRAVRVLFAHGHLGFDRLLGRRTRYITVLRDPIKRIESQYWHNRIVSGPTLTLGAHTLPLSTIVNEGLTEEFDNLQTRYLAGVGPILVPCRALTENELELALFNAAEYFDFIGKSETIDADFGEMCRLLEVPCTPLPRMNATQSVNVDRNDADYCRIDWTAVARRNRLDIALLRHLGQEHDSHGS